VGGDYSSDLKSLNYKLCAVPGLNLVLWPDLGTQQILTRGANGTVKALQEHAPEEHEKNVPPVLLACSPSSPLTFKNLQPLP
jgi:hypothetical protein